MSPRAETDHQRVLQKRFDEAIAEIVSEYRMRHRMLPMASIVESLENAKRAAEESGEQ